MTTQTTTTDPSDANSADGSILVDVSNAFGTISYDWSNGITTADNENIPAGNYDLTITEAGKNALAKEDSKLKISKSQNGKYYLPKGKYTVKIGNEQTELEIK